MGSRWETEDDSGISHLLQQVLLKGSERRSALQIAERPREGLGGGISASADLDYSEIHVTALARNWKAMLELIADVALRPTLPAGEIDGERRATLTALRSRQDQPFSLAMDTLMSRVYGDHPYGRPILGRPAALERVDRARLAAHHQRFYRAPRMILAVSGDIDTRLVMAEVGRSSPTPHRPRGGRADAARGRVARDRTVIVRASAQAQVLAGFLAPPTSHADYAAVKVLAAALGGGMAGRLFTEVRDKQGWPTRPAAPTGRARARACFTLNSAPRRPTRPGRRARCWGARAYRGAPEPGRAGSRERVLPGAVRAGAAHQRAAAWWDAFFEALGVGRIRRALRARWRR
jgi:predicted Zn-dependent peptidase